MWLLGEERRLPWWLKPRPCAFCGRRAWRCCLVCLRRVCKWCRIGSSWEWCCLDPRCRAGFLQAKRDLRQLRLLERTVVCWSCSALYTRQLVRVLEPTGPDDVMELRHVVIQHPGCTCPQPPRSRSSPGSDDAG